MNGAQRILDWAPIVGLWDLSDVGSPTYMGPQQLGQTHPLGLCVSNIRLSEGEVRATVCLPDVAPSTGWSGRILLGYRSPADEYIIVGLGGYGYAYTISHFDAARGWRGLALAGSEQNLRSEHGYRLIVRVRGQRVILEVDNVRVLDHVLAQPLAEGQVGLFTWSQATVKFSDISSISDPGSAFVVMQFSQPYQELYEDVIKRVVEDEFHLRAYHVGEVSGSGIILDDIVKGIAEAKVVIADITPTNENVYYELGYAHALKKPTILLAEKSKTIPFDIGSYRRLIYENTIGGKRRLMEGLKKQLEAVLDREGEHHAPAL